ncbi:MAG: hypothetical protein ACXWLR_08260 [Myxococcales bacterium]
MKPFLALPLALSFACSGMSSSTTPSSAAASQSCGQMLPAVAYRGSAVFAVPDSSTGPVSTLSEDTPVCASPDLQGFGFRKIKLANGNIGYVTESSLSI